MQFPAGNLRPHMIRHMSEKPDEVTVCELCLVSAAADSATIAVDGAVAAVFDISVFQYCLCFGLLNVY